MPIITKNNVYLILTNKFSPAVVKLYHQVRNAVQESDDVFLLYHLGNHPKPELAGISVSYFTDNVLTDIGYKAIGQTLVPGNNHFPLLAFYQKNPDYKNYWCIEDDVAFTSDWRTLFNEIDNNQKFDFVTSHIRRFNDFPVWHWWQSLKDPTGKQIEDALFKSFNPIYMISNNALHYLDQLLKAGYSGHHEVLMPTMLMAAGFKLADLGVDNNHVTPSLSFCTLRTMRWKPNVFIVGTEKNKLYHPVKSSYTFRQVLVYIKRLLTNKRRYIE